MKVRFEDLIIQTECVQAISFNDKDKCCHVLISQPDITDK